MDIILDYGKEILAFTVDAIVFAYSLSWHKQNRKAQRALSGPTIQDKASLEEWLYSNPKGRWAVVQGSVEPIGPVIRSFNDRTIKGVVQRLKVKEFITARHTSGFWQDGERIITDSFNTVPFSLQVGQCVVQVDLPLGADLLTLHNVSSEFTQKNSNVLDHVWGFVVGTRHRGIQTTEDMLICGTRLTGIGALVEDNTKSPARAVLVEPHFLSQLSVPEISKHNQQQLRWSSALLILSGAVGLAILAYTAHRALKQRKKRLEEEERRCQRFKKLRSMRHGEPMCVVCDENPREVILLPCGHICLCYDCSQVLGAKCPMCRARIDTINEFFIT